MKKSTRKMTNHKSVSFTCVKLFVLERALGQILNPMKYIPNRLGFLFSWFWILFILFFHIYRFFIHGTDVVQAGDLGALMGIDETTLIFRNPTITWNYQTFHTGCFLVNDGEFFQADTFYAVSESLFCLGPNCWSLQLALTRRIKECSIRPKRSLFKSSAHGWLILLRRVICLFWITWKNERLLCIQI